MKSCPNCGWSNEDQNRFCENCGADFSGLAASGQAPQTPSSTWRPPLEPSEGSGSQSSWEAPPSAPDWRMAPLPPEELPPPRGRRIWLWIVGILFLACVLMCAGSVFWLGYTDSGRNFQTEVSERATEEAE